MADPLPKFADLDELADLAATAKRYFRWDIMLLLAALCILVLDFQIMRAVSRQGVSASEAYARAEGLSGRASPDVAATPDDRGQRGGGGGDAVDGSAAVAEGPDPAGRPKQARGRRVVERPEGNAP